MELELIQSKIFELRGFRVMLDFHLAELYQIETRILKQSVRRNIDRFPSDFMFKIDKEESKLLISMGVSQFVTPPDYNIGVSSMFVFTEQGVAMLSSVLRSPTAIAINISIMRAFVMFRHLSVGYEELRRRVEQLEQQGINTSVQFTEIYHALSELGKREVSSVTPRRPVGYLASHVESAD
jgi:hypothetical protein